MTIALTQGKTAIVDDRDFGWLSKYKWQAKRERSTGKYYAARTVYGENGNTFTIFMHREILSLVRGQGRVDHIDGDGLNNSRGNLRLSTATQNAYNRGRPRNNKTGYKGVSWITAHRKFSAQITVSGKRYHLGLYVSAEEAYAAYCARAAEHHGEFARLA